MKSIVKRFLFVVSLTLLLPLSGLEFLAKMVAYPIWFVLFGEIFADTCYTYLLLDKLFPEFP